MKIPKSFQLHGRSYSVKVVAESQWDRHCAEHNIEVSREETCHGFFLPWSDEVHLKRQARGLMEHAYLHELYHAICAAMNGDFDRDEKQVDMIAGLLHQAIKSAR